MTAQAPRKRRWRRWLLGALALAVLALVVLGALAGRLAREPLERQISEATGLSARIDELEIDLLSLRARVRGLSLSDGERSLLTLERLSLRAAEWPRLGGPVRLKTLEANGLRVDARSPWPRPPGEGGGALPERSPVRIEQISIRDAQVALPGVESPLQLEFRAHLSRDGLTLRDVSASIADLASARLSGSIDLFGVEEPVARLQLEAGGNASLWPAVWLERAPGLTLLGPVELRAEGEGTISSHELSASLRARELRHESGARIASLHARPTWRRSGESWELSGPWQAESVELRQEGWDSPLRLDEPSGGLSARPDVVGLVLERAAVGDGELRGELDLDDGIATWSAELERIDGRGLPVGGDWPLAPGLLSGRVGGRLPVAEPAAAELDLVLSSAPAGDCTGPPSRVTGDLRAVVRDRAVELGPSELAWAGARISMEGRLPFEGDGELTLSLRVPELSATLPPLLVLFEAERPGLEDWSGDLRFDGRLEGSLQSPTLVGLLVLDELSDGRREAGRLSAELQAGREAVALSELELDGAWGRASGRARWRPDSFAASTAQLSVEELDLAVASTLAGLGFELAGRATGTAVLEGGQARLSFSSSDTELAGVRLDRWTLEASATEEGAVLDALRLEAGGGAAELSARHVFGLEGRSSVALRFQDFQLSQEWAGQPWATTLSGDARAAGGLTPESWSGEGELRAAQTAWAERAWPVLAARLELREGELRIEPTEGPLRGELRGPLEAEAPRELQVEVERLALGELVPPALWPEDVGAVELGPSLLRASLVGDAFDWEASVESLRAEHAGAELQTLEPLLLRGDASGWALSSTRMSLDGRELRFEASQVLAEPDGLSAAVSGGFDLASVAGALPDGTRLRGQAEFQLRLRGSMDDPRLLGRARLEEVSLRSPAFPVPLEGGTASLEWSGERVELVRLNGTLGGGELEATGALDLDGWQPAAHRLALSARDVRLTVPEGFAGLASLELELEGDAAASTLSGQVRLAEGRYTKDVRLERALATTRRAPPRVRRPGALDAVRLDLRVSSEQDLRLRNDLATAELAVDLDVRGTAARPLITGTVDVRPGGALRFQSVTYRLLDGEASFSPAHANDPTLQALATARLGSYDVNLELGGRLSQPRVELSSVPELPRERLVALLLSGGRLGAPGAGPPGSVAEVAPSLAEDYLRGRLDPLERRAREALRLDVVEIDPVINASADARGARLTLGKSLSPRVFLSQSVLFGGAGDATTELRVALTERFSLHEIHEWDGSNVVEGRWSRSFGPESRASAAAEGGAGSRWSLRLPGWPDERQARRLVKEFPASRARPRDALESRRLAESLLAELRPTGHPFATVACAPTGERTVSCEAEPGRRVRLSVEGATGRRQRERVETAVRQSWSFAFQDEDLGELARREAQERLVEAGHLRAEVETRLSTEDDGSERLHVQLRPGPVVRLDGVDVAGESPLAEEIRRAARSAFARGFRDPPVSAQLAGQAASAVEDLHRAAGHLDVEASAELVAAEDSDHARLQVSVEPGELWSLGEVRFSGADEADERAWRERLRPGAAVDPVALDRLADEIVATLDARGHLDPAVDWVLSRTGDATVDADVAVTAGPSWTIASIDVEGLVRTRESHVRRVLGLESGEPLSRALLAQARRRLRDTGLFSSSIVRPAEDESGEPTGGVLVRLRERDPSQISIGLGLDSEDGGRASFSHVHRNLDGRGRSLGTHLRLSSGDSSVEGRLHWPRLRGGSWSLLETARWQRDEEDGWAVRRLGVRSELSRALGQRQRLRLHHLADRLSAAEVELGIFDPDRDEGRLSELGVGWVLDGRDDPASTRRGRLTSLELRVAHASLASQVEQVVVEWHQAWWRPLGSGRLVLAGSLRIGAGWALDGGERLVLSERFRVGGTGSLRGYRHGRAGPLDPLSGEAAGGDAQLVWRNELRVPLRGGLTGLLFADAGRGFEDVEDLPELDLLYSLGLGLGIETPAGPLRLSYGFALNAPSSEPSGRLHFTFGTSF